MLEKLYRLLKELAGFNRKPMPVFATHRKAIFNHSSHENRSCRDYA